MADNAAPAKDFSPITTEPRCSVLTLTVVEAARQPPEKPRPAVNPLPKDPLQPRRRWPQVPRVLAGLTLLSAIGFSPALLGQTPSSGPGAAPGTAASDNQSAGLSHATATTGRIVTGPMIGPVDHREAWLWVQTDAPTTVQARFWPVESPEAVRRSPPVTTIWEGHLTAHLRLGPLDAGSRYGYGLDVLRADGSTAQSINPPHGFIQTPPDFRERFPPTDVSLALISGHYVNDRRYDPLNRIPGGGYEIFEAIRQAQPAALFWLGGTATLLEPDWGSHSGINERYRQARALPELAPLLTAVPQLATWGATDAAPRFSLPGSSTLAATRNLFRAYWPRPDHGLQDDLVTTFRWSDVEVFILDDRSHRNVSATLPGLRQVYGKTQLEWLAWQLQSSAATFKVVVSGSPLLNPSETPGNATEAPIERNGFLDALRSRRIGNVLFVVGGKPFGELSRMVRANAQDLLELTVGPVTARPSDSVREVNFLREPGTTTRERQFALLSFSGAEGDRRLTISVRGTDGRELWSRIVPEGQLAWQER